MDEADKVTTAHFPIVGIGASAGGLAAFEAFFSGMPADKDPGMAFVVVQHLAPDHKSILTDLIRQYTRMEVFEVTDGMEVKPNCTYIIPPNRDMDLIGGTLHLIEPAAPRGQRLPIDYFFRSLALDQKERAICIVLSGTGSDGTLGVRAIKSAGGMVMVQNPDSCDYDGMPRSVIATGLADYELPPAEMASQLMAYAAHAFGRFPLPAPELPLEEEKDNTLKKIFVLLRAQTGHDFSQYKPRTICRRIERRMAVHQIDSMNEYVKFANQTPKEVEALFRDLLIGVTNFFRDPEVFQALKEQVIPKLLEGKVASAPIRVWSIGCSTGEEAYSLAILLAERREEVKQTFNIQVFASDIDSQAIAVARAGVYPASIASDMTPERLKRFFSPDADGTTFRIQKRIRDMVVFSEHSVIESPPFSRLNLISCRNLLIYLNADIQKKLTPLFHYALVPAGFLLLGTSENIGDFGDLFTAVDRKAKLYQRVNGFQGLPRPVMSTRLPADSEKKSTFPEAAHLAGGTKRLPLRELTEQALLREWAPAGILVDNQGDILYIHGRTGLFLEPVAGEVGVNNVLKMAREGLRGELTAALRKATAGSEVVRKSGLRVKTNGDFTRADLSISPLATGPAERSDEPLYLVMIQQAVSTDHEMEPLMDDCDVTDKEDGAEKTNAARVIALQEEMRTKDEHIRTTNEELETANEELRSSIEEMQSINEEMQSSNEELETSKEELQSVNEELSTVNAELQMKVADLSRSQNDMNNLLASTGIGTIFLDQGLNIQRYTPDAAKVVNLIRSDVGRSIGHIVSNLVNYETFLTDIQAVLDTLIPKEVNVQSRAGQWYAMRILPYRTLENAIEGVVITFTDITESKRLEAAIRDAHIRLAEAVVATVREPLLVLDASLQVISANQAFYRTFRVNPEVTMGKVLFELSDRQWDIPALRERLAQVLQSDAEFDGFNVSYQMQLGELRTMRLNGRRIVGASEQTELILLAIEDLGDHPMMEHEDVQRSREPPNDKSDTL